MSKISVRHATPSSGENACCFVTFLSDKLSRHVENFITLYGYYYTSFCRLRVDSVCNMYKITQEIKGIFTYMVSLLGVMQYFFSFNVISRSCVLCGDNKGVGCVHKMCIREKGSSIDMGWGKGS